MKSPVPAFVLFVALALRFPGLWTDLWLDEILSFALLRDMASPLGIFTEIHFDTNHWLYSFWLWACGPGRDAWVYRLPAFLAGLAAVLLAAEASRRLGARRPLIAAALAAVSFPLVFYSSEARGYAFLVMFSLLAFVALDQALRLPSWAPGFWAAACAGLLSHLTFLNVFAGLALYAAARRAAPRLDVRAITRDLARLFAVPALLFAWLYWIDVRKMGHAGADETPLLDVVGTMAAGTLGLPRQPASGALAIAVVVAFAVAGIVRLVRARDAAWVLFAATIFVIPAALVAARPDFHDWTPRHFLAAVPFFLLLCAHLVEAALAAGRGARAAAVAALVAFAAGNLLACARFLGEGRGHYLDALQFIAKESRSRPPVVGSDHDFRNLMLIEHYVALLPAGSKLVYCRAADCANARPEWYIVHDTAETPAPHPDEIAPEGLGSPYRLERHFGFSGWSGWHWFVYRRASGSS